MRRGGKRRDSTEPGIVAVLEAAGARVFRIQESNPSGFWDLVVGYQGETLLLEVKGPDGALEVTQKRTHADWNGGPHFVVETETQALAALRVASALATHRVRSRRLASR